VLTLPSGVGATRIISRFETSAEGWLVANYEAIPSVAGAVEPTYQPGPQNIATSTQFGWTAFVAPAKFYGDRSEFLGGHIDFHLSSDRADFVPFSRFIVALHGHDVEIYHLISGAPNPLGTAFGLVLGVMPGDWIVGHDDRSGRAESWRQPRWVNG
jgi:hypothetical protein